MVIGLAAPAIVQDYSLDSNSGSIVGHDEWTWYGSNTFGAYDQDGNGVLDQNEFEESDGFGLGMAEGNTDDWFSDWDVNNDEGLGNNEYFRENKFNEYDEDGDGLLVKTSGSGTSDGKSLAMPSARPYT
jgi:hypothetical protein